MQYFSPEIFVKIRPLDFSPFVKKSSGLVISEKKKKDLKSLRFQYLGGDKRDRTADLLNAMAAGHGQYEYC